MGCLTRIWELGMRVLNIVSCVQILVAQSTDIYPFPIRIPSRYGIYIHLYDNAAKGACLIIILNQDVLPSKTPMTSYGDSQAVRLSVPIDINFHGPSTSLPYLRTANYGPRDSHMMRLVERALSVHTGLLRLPISVRLLRRI